MIQSNIAKSVVISGEESDDVWNDGIRQRSESESVLARMGIGLDTTILDDLGLSPGYGSIHPLNEPRSVGWMMLRTPATKKPAQVWRASARPTCVGCCLFLSCGFKCCNRGQNVTSPVLQLPHLRVGSCNKVTSWMLQSHHADGVCDRSVQERMLITDLVIGGRKSSFPFGRRNG